jgi:hypothetical protein
MEASKMKRFKLMAVSAIVFLSNSVFAEIMTCETVEAQPRQFLLVIDALTEQQGSAGFLFQKIGAEFNQIYPASFVVAGHDVLSSEIFLNASDSSKVNWENRKDCFRVVGSDFFFRISLTVPPGVKTYMGRLLERIGARVNPEGVNCPRVMLPPVQQFQIECRAN